VKLSGILVVFIVAACTPTTSPEPSTQPSPTITVRPTQAHSIDDRLAAVVEWSFETPRQTTEVQATWTTAVALQYTPELPPHSRVLVAEAPDHAWRVAYESEPYAALERLSGGGAHWTFTETRIGGGQIQYLAQYVDRTTGAVVTLGRSTFPQSQLGDLEQRVRPTVVSDFGSVAWTEIHVVGGAPVWELRATENNVPDAPVRSITTSRQRLALLTTNGAIAYVVANPDGDELVVHNTVTGLDSRWAHASRITEAAWTSAGLALVRSSGGMSEVAVVDAAGNERILAGGPDCRSLAAYGRYLTWTCELRLRTDLRAYDLDTGRYFLVGRSRGARGYRVADKAFVWLEPTNSVVTVRLVALPP
jgi:hypothetical protein